MTNINMLLNNALIKLKEQQDFIDRGYFLSDTEAQQLNELQVTITKLRDASIMQLDKNNRRKTAMEIFNLSSARISQIKKTFQNK